MPDDPRMRRLKGLRPLVGNTPLVSVRLRYRGRECRVHAKAEYLNLTGSIKDRMAFHICRTAIQQGVLGPDATIVEATSGNTGIAFAALGAALGHPVVIFMPDWMSEERKAVIRSFGADIRLVSREAGGFLGSIANAETLGRELGSVFLPRQFDNQANVQAHATTTGPELVSQLASLGLTPDAFVAGVGTGGTVMGVAQAFSRLGVEARVHPLEPAESPTLSTGHKVGRHRIQGVSDEFIPGILRLDALAPVIQVSDGDAILMAQKLARELGLGVGISSGANLLGALQVLEREGRDATVATIFCDDNKKYLSTDLARVEEVRPGFHSPDVELLDFETTLTLTS
jgi:cysteine synthase A